MVPAEVAKRHLSTPDGAVEDCWVVTAIEAEGGTSRVVFSGYQASARATEYARAKYAPVHFRMTAEPGKYSTSLEMKPNGIESRN